MFAPIIWWNLSRSKTECESYNDSVVVYVCYRARLPTWRRSGWRFRRLTINVRAARWRSLLSNARVGCARPRVVTLSDSSPPFRRGRRRASRLSLRIFHRPEFRRERVRASVIARQRDSSQSARKISQNFYIATHEIVRYRYLCHVPILLIYQDINVKL